MAVEVEALKYAQEKFSKRGIIADQSDMACVVEYINEYYDRIRKAGHKRVRVVRSTNNSKRVYLYNALPDVPHTVIDGVLEAEDRYYSEGVVKQDE